MCFVEFNYDLPHLLRDQETKRNHVRISEWARGNDFGGGMSKCDRTGVNYKRHKYKQGICVKCKAVQSVQLLALAKRRDERKAKKVAARAAAA